MAHDISQITDYLFISSWPREHHVEEILALNIRLILSMHWIRPDRALNRPPLRVIHLPTIDTPLTPMPIYILRRGAKAAIPVIHDGRAVLVHCKAGVHRSVAMACCVLIAMGYTADEAMQTVAERRSVADPYAWYIARRIRTFETSWKTRQPESDG